jgi:hypothetical protein
MPDSCILCHASSSTWENTGEKGGRGNVTNTKRMACMAGVEGKSASQRTDILCHASGSTCAGMAGAGVSVFQNELSACGRGINH